MSSVVVYLLQFDDVAMHDAGAVRREEQHGAHDEYEVLVSAPARGEGAYEGLVRAVHVARRQLQHLRSDAAELLLAVRQLRHTTYTIHLHTLELVSQNNLFADKCEYSQSGCLLTTET